MVVLFWLELWEIFLSACNGVWTGDLWISSPVLYHCAMATSGFHLWQFEVFNCGAEGLVVVLCLLDLWEIFFLPGLEFALGTCGSLVLHSTPVPWRLLDFTSDNLRYLTLVQGIAGHIVLIGPVRDFLFVHSGVWNGDLWISSPSLYLWGMATSGFHLWWFEVFNSGVEGLVVLLFWLDLWEIFIWLH